MVSFEASDMKKIGLGLTGFGIIFTFVGILLFFDKGFLAMGNILFLSGVTLTIGVKSTLQFFMKPELQGFDPPSSSLAGSVSFGVGFFFVLIGWPMIGMIVETYGFIVLFSSLRGAEAGESCVRILSQTRRKEFGADKFPL
ncbi:Vesicle transport protein GOT1 [Camellia lanceoleosa]|uniref:Vesicle transport protein GOT1 n=1 Tax=Camellia lanceoleosa TaxID=1840588 RepID=A0ACC0IVI8_9ERIC|nr:Vesicle transport protein GOT1 [Camellia lanceoleosa]